MKLHKYLLLLSAVAGCMAYAAGVVDDRTNDKPEKVKPAENMNTKMAGSTIAYPQVRLEGTDDGIPYGLRLMDVSNKDVTLSWLSPEPTDGYFDDFESHDDFVVNSPGSVGWSYLDADNANTYTWQACTFPNMGQRMAFIVMNPSQTSPATDTNPNYMPYSGNKMLVDFCAVGTTNNDYIISPSLSFSSDFKVSFMARSYSDGYNLERVRVGYSTTGTRPSDFTFVNEGDYVELPAEWTFLEYDIPQEARYVTINCVSDDAFMLLIDDIFVGTNKVRPGVAPKTASADARVEGFNIYRDGVKVNDSPVRFMKYTDVVPDYSTYNYNVTAVYSDGTESDMSETLNVEVPDIRLLPFEDDFSDWTMDDDMWTIVNHDGVDYEYWSVSYYTTGLVDPCATYSYSSLTNYNQSLVTRELNTPNIAGTYLRFNLRLSNYRTQNVDYLTVELTDDGGQTWKQIDEFDNTEGSFDWRICQYNIGSMLDSNLFQVRFRAHGTTATYIDYWYVDDVKVWTPDLTTGTLTVTNADGHMAGCDVTLTGLSGAVLEGTTDEAGQIAFDMLEKDTYTVDIVHDGYNVYSETWTVGEGDNAFTAALTRPIPVLSQTEITAEVAAGSATTQSFTLSNTGDGPMAWYFNTNITAAGAGDASSLWQLNNAFNASGDLQSCVAFDGENYYTSSYTELGQFWKYDKNGRFIETFRLPDMYFPVYDLTYDGRYFYGSDNTNRIFQFDFNNRRVVGIITVESEPDLEITHCSYDPRNDQFWVGSWNSLCRVNRNGTIVRRLTNYFDQNESLSIMGTAFDNVSPGGPYLWLADGTTSDTMLDRVRIYQYSLTSGRLTGVSHLATDVPGYKIGNSTTGVNIIGGISSSLDIVDGKLVLTGILQQSPALIFNYTLCDVDDWMAVSPKHGILAPGEQQQIDVAFNSIDTKMGDTFSATANLLTIPELEAQGVNITMNVTAESATPRPVSLQAEPGVGQVALSWQPGDANRLPQGYNVYCNGEKVNSDVVAETTYTDDKLVYGTYVYKVTAVYGDNVESLASDSVEVFVKQGAQYYAPLSAEATISENKNVKLTWRSPLADAGYDAVATWSTGEHVDQLGISAGGYFYAASVWSADDLVPYRNKTISSVGVQIVNPCTFLQLRIIKDGEIIYRKAYSGNYLYDGTFTEVTVDEPITIEPGAEYYFAFMIMNSSGVMPLGIDGSDAINGKGNMLSMDGSEWIPATYQGIGGNFNINVNFSPADAAAEQAPIGYNIYRDGIKLNGEIVTATEYADVVETSGTHVYTITSVYADGGESAESNEASVKVVAIDGRYAPAEADADVHVNRDVTLRWSYPASAPSDFKVDITTRPVTVSDNLPEYVNTFDGVDTGIEMAIASDNKFIYTSTYSADGRINKYSLAGDYIESFTINGVEGIRNLVYDGEYFYAGDNSTSIHRIDMDTRTLLESMPISEFSRHLAYVPDLDGGNGGFEVGDWETSIYVNKGGSKLADGPTLLGASGTVYHAGRIYAFEQGGDNRYTIGVYDFNTKHRLGSIDLASYSELGDLSTASSGGMSLITRPDGSEFMALAIQRTNGTTRFAFLELGTVSGVVGYNVYRDGTRLNDEILTHRYFEESLDNVGDYDYTIETVYVDGTTSAHSAPLTVTIVDKGVAETPVDVKAVQSTYGYNVLLSFVAPDINAGAAATESFETAEAQTAVSAQGWINSGNAWTVSADQAYEGVKSMAAEADRQATIIIPADGMRCLKMAVRNADDHNGNGSISVLRSVGGTDDANLVPMATYTTNEAWTEVECQLPEGTEYVAIRKAADTGMQYVDAIRLYTDEPQSNVYAYDVFRDGEQINTEPIQAISYIDRNLLPGHYDYQVRLTTTLSAVSELSEKVGIDLDYDNGGLAPTGLTAGWQEDGSVKLDWQFPALGEPIYLRWHTGSTYDAGGLPSGGAFFAGARWYASDLKDYGSLALTDVEFYINQIPDALFILVYQGNTIVRQQYVPTLHQYSYNNVKLDEPLTIDPTKDMLVALYIEHNEISIPLGYDQGPANGGRGNLYSTDGTTWGQLSDDDTDIDANWNISIGLSPYSNTPLTPAASRAARKKVFAPKLSLTNERLMSAPAGAQAKSQANAFLGYNVYCNRDRINDATVSETTYIDDAPAQNKYLEYQVSAIYSASGEAYSAPVTLTVTGIDEVTTAGGLTVSMKDGNVCIRGLKAGTTVSMYNTAGVQMYSGVAADAFEHVIPALSVPRGTYIVKAGADAVKIVKE